jgi:hypothetical protein
MVGVAERGELDEDPVDLVRLVDLVSAEAVVRRLPRIGKLEDRLAVGELGDDVPRRSQRCVTWDECLSRLQRGDVRPRLAAPLVDIAAKGRQPPQVRADDGRGHENARAHPPCSPPLQDPEALGDREEDPDQRHRCVLALDRRAVLHLDEQVHPELGTGNQECERTQDGQHEPNRPEHLHRVVPVPSSTEQLDDPARVANRVEDDVAEPATEFREIRLVERRGSRTIPPRDRHLRAQKEPAEAEQRHRHRRHPVVAMNEEHGHTHGCDRQGHVLLARHRDTR